MPARRKLFAVANRFIQARKISAQVRRNVNRRQCTDVEMEFYRRQ